MEKSTGKSTLTFKSRAISLAVLVGFLCIQFHSLSHIHLGSLNIGHENHQIERILNKFDSESSEDQKINIDCPDCVLTKHIQADVGQSILLDLNRSSQTVAASQNEFIFESTHYIYHLRAPPISSIS